MPVSVVIGLLILAAVAVAVEPYLRRRQAELQPTPDRERLGVTRGACTWTRPVPVVSDRPPPPPPPPLVLPTSYGQLPGHRYYRRLAAVIPARTRPYNHEVDGL